MTNPGSQYQPQQPGHSGPWQQTGQPYPQQPPAKKRGGCMKWVLIVLGALIAIAIISSIAGGGDTGTGSAPDTTTARPQPAATDNAEAPTSEPTVAPAPAEPETPREFKNALRSAERYLSVSAFSQQGLAEQLAFENYSPEAAQYAAENVDADWNEQAAKKAEQYMSMSPMSRQGLVDQLQFEKFTAEQAEYGASRAY